MIQKHTDSICPTCKTKSETGYVCRFKELVGLLPYYDQTLNICPNCGLIYVSNPIDQKIVDRYYAELSKYEGKKSAGKVAAPRLKMSQRQYKFIANEVKDFENVLDIGASTGFYLSVFQSEGYEVYGIEPSPNNQRYAKELYDIDLFQGTFEEYMGQQNQKKYDLITLSHVLEHISNTSEFIKKLKTINNRYVFIEVPCFDYQRQDEPFGAFFYEHVNYFTVESLSYLMSLWGYQPIKIQIELNVDGTAPNIPCLVSLWKKEEEKINPIKGVNQSRFLLNEYIKRSKEEFAKVKDKIAGIDSNCKLAIWGTGSHTSRLLGTTNLEEKNIIRFYDSDPKKHKFTMLGRPIVPFDEEDIRTGKVDTILVSTFAGEKAIASYVKELDIDVELITLYQ